MRAILILLFFTTPVFAEDRGVIEMEQRLSMKLQELEWWQQKMESDRRNAETDREVEKIYENERRRTDAPLRDWRY